MEQSSKKRVIQFTIMGLIILALVGLIGWQLTSLNLANFGLTPESRVEPTDGSYVGPGSELYINSESFSARKEIDKPEPVEPTLELVPDALQRISVPAPAAIDSPEQRVDYANMVRYQQSVTEEQVRQIHDEVSIYDTVWKGQKLSDIVDPATKPISAAFLEQMLSEVRGVVTYYKDYYDYPRPFLAVRDIKYFKLVDDPESVLTPEEEAVLVENTPGYPSMRAAEAFVVATFLTRTEEIAPEEALKSFNEQMDARVNVGLVSNQDIRVGNAIAQQYYAMMLENDVVPPELVDEWDHIVN